jgi:hypothetical protein
MAKSVKTSAITSANTLTVTSAAANTAAAATAAAATAAAAVTAAATAAAATAAAATAAAAHDERSGSGSVFSNNTRECNASPSSDMSLDVIEEMLEAAAATATHDNGESHMRACRHCTYSLYLYCSVQCSVQR